MKARPHACQGSITTPSATGTANYRNNLRAGFPFQIKPQRVYAAPPNSQKGTRIARTHADTFYIPKSFENKDASWEVLKWLTAEENIIEVCLVYGCLPSRQSVSEEYTEQMAARYGDHDYSVIYNSIDYLDSPHHESWMPDVERANDVLGSDIYDRVFTEHIEDTVALLEEANTQIQSIFDEYWADQ